MAAAPADVQWVVIAQEPFDQQPGTITPSSQPWLPGLDGLPESSRIPLGLLQSISFPGQPQLCPAGFCVCAMFVFQQCEPRAGQLQAVLAQHCPHHPHPDSSAGLCWGTTHTQVCSWSPQELWEHWLCPTCQRCCWLRGFPPGKCRNAKATVSSSGTARHSQISPLKVENTPNGVLRICQGMCSAKLSKAQQFSQRRRDLGST